MSALALFALLIAQDPATLSAEAASAMRGQNYADAVRVYRSLILKDAGNPMWHLNLGMALFYAGDHTAAATELADFIRLHPEPGAGHLFLGVSRLKLEQPCEAIAPLETALRWPKRPQSRWTELADAYQGCKRWEQAAKAYAEAAKQDPANHRVVRQCAHCWRLARRYDLAKPLFVSLAGQYAGNAEFQFEYGDTLMRLDGAAAGLLWLTRSVASDPLLMPAQSALGRALFELDRPADAVTHLEAAAKTDPALLLPLSRAYRAVNRSAEAAHAEAEYRRLLRAAP